MLLEVITFDLIVFGSRILFWVRDASIKQNSWQVLQVSAPQAKGGVRVLRSIGQVVYPNSAATAHDLLDLDKGARGA